MVKHMPMCLAGGDASVAGRGGHGVGGRQGDGGERGGAVQQGVPAAFRSRRVTATGEREGWIDMDWRDAMKARFTAAHPSPVIIIRRHGQDGVHRARDAGAAQGRAAAGGALLPGGGRVEDGREGDGAVAGVPGGRGGARGGGGGGGGAARAGPQWHGHGLVPKARSRLGGIYERE